VQPASEVLAEDVGHDDAAVLGQEADTVDALEAKGAGIVGDSPVFTEDGADSPPSPVSCVAVTSWRAVEMPVPVRRPVARKPIGSARDALRLKVKRQKWQLSWEV
jgi:hypothetical protein